MTDPGLNHRLRQRSRRAGLMIGISMLLTIAVCVGSFSIIYAQLDTIVGDFVSRNEPGRTRTSAPTEASVVIPTEAPSGEPTAAPTVEPTPVPTERPVDEAEPEPTKEADDEEFDPDYQLDSAGSVNLRSGPGTRYDIITAITLEQPLEYLDESEPTADPAADNLDQGQVWMKFRTENGEEGWIREIDVTEYVP